MKCKGNKKHPLFVRGRAIFTRRAGPSCPARTEIAPESGISRPISARAAHGKPAAAPARMPVVRSRVSGRRHSAGSAAYIRSRRGTLPQRTRRPAGRNAAKQIDRKKLEIPICGPPAGLRAVSSSQFPRPKRSAKKSACRDCNPEISGQNRPPRASGPTVPAASRPKRRGPKVRLPRPPIPGPGAVRPAHHASNVTTVIPAPPRSACSSAARATSGTVAR